VLARAVWRGRSYEVVCEVGGVGVCELDRLAPILVEASRVTDVDGAAAVLLLDRLATGGIGCSVPYAETYRAVVIVTELRPDCAHGLTAEAGEREESDGFGDGRHDSCVAWCVKSDCCLWSISISLYVVFE